MIEFPPGVLKSQTLHTEPLAVCQSQQWFLPWFLFVSLCSAKLLTSCYLPGCLGGSSFTMSSPLRCIQEELLNSQSVQVFAAVKTK